MVLIYYDNSKEKIYICTEESEMKCVDAKDPDILNYIPNDDITYVQSAHIVNKQQFSDWLNGSLVLENISINEQEYETKSVSASVSPHIGKLFIHPTRDGGITIPSIQTKRFPDGLIMMTRWDFIPLDEIGGEEALTDNIFLKTLLKNKKIEKVNYDFILANKDKISKSLNTSLSDEALDKIIVKDYKSGSARKVARSGGLAYDDEDDDYDANSAIPVRII